MSIDRISISNAAIDRSLQTHATTEEARSAERTRAASGGQDALSLSSAAKDADRLSNMVHESREERLSAVREAISNGTYRVSGLDIAAKLIDLNSR